MPYLTPTILYIVHVNNDIVLSVLLLRHIFDRLPTNDKSVLWFPLQDWTSMKLDFVSLFA